MSRMVEVEAFVAVVAESSFAGAATRLGVSGSYVSKLVSRLEDRLGARLLRRSTRRLTLTEAGQRFHADCAEAMARVDDAERVVRAQQATPSGTLRVTLPTSIGLGWLSRAVASFMAAWPAVSLDAVYSDRMVDLIGEGFDVAIRAGRLPDSALVVRRLAMARRRVVASPGYLEQHGWPKTIAELSGHRCLLYSHHRMPSVWQLYRNGESDGGSGGETASVTVMGPMAANNGTVLADAAACGVGVACLPDFHTTHHLEAGDLVDVFPEWGDPVPVQAVFPSARDLPPKVRVFVEAVAAELSRMPWARPG